MSKINNLKKNARQTLKKHYFILVLICLISAHVGGQLFVAGDLSGGNNLSAISGGETPFTVNSKSPQVLSDISDGNLKKGEETSQTALKEYREGKDQSKVAGRTRGKLASAVNSLTSGSTLMKIANGIYVITKSKALVSIIFTITSLALSLCFWIFLQNILQVVIIRMFFEAGTYKQVPLQHMLYLFSTRKWFHSSLALFRYSVFKALWWLTIIGGPIKTLSYYAVPYIIAENPGITGKEAIALSQKMMYGHKWECFLYHLSFLHWYLLSYITLGIVGMLYFTPYCKATFCEYYKTLRDETIKENLEGSDKLIGEVLFSKPSDSNLKKKYADIYKDDKYVQKHKVKLTGIREFFAKYLSLWIGSVSEKRKYQKIENVAYKVNREKQELEGNSYPMRLDPYFLDRRSPFIIKNNALRCYSGWSLVAMFFIFSFFGWCWEVSLHLVNSGVFVNRGTMIGPWLPIYGFGGIMVLTLLSSLRKHPIVEFFSAVVLCGFVEFGTSYFLQMRYNMRWWDYTGYFLNLDGRICAEGLLVFAVGGFAIVYLIAPSLDMLFSKISLKKFIPICCIFLVLFSTDFVYSQRHPNTGKGVTNYTAYKQDSNTH